MTSKSLWWCYMSCFITISVGLTCESYDYKCNINNTKSRNTSACPRVQQCDGSTSACFALFGSDNEGRLQLMMKGCVTENSGDCRASAVCQGTQRTFNKMRPLYYCCCVKDMCNHDAVFVANEVNEKNCTMEDVKESLRRLYQLIWVHLITASVMIISTIVLLAWMLFSARRARRKCNRRNVLSEVKCNGDVSLLGKASHWKKQDFQLITCLVRSKFGEVWQARLHGSNQVVRIRVSADSDEVYVYDENYVVYKNTNARMTRGRL